jgi:hypothetical protein
VLAPLIALFLAGAAVRPNPARLPEKIKLASKPVLKIQTVLHRCPKHSK